jgi:hypothetical protein
MDREKEIETTDRSKPEAGQLIAFRNTLIKAERSHYSKDQ